MRGGIPSSLRIDGGHHPSPFPLKGKGNFPEIWVFGSAKPNKHPNFRFSFAQADHHSPVDRSGCIARRGNHRQQRWLDGDLSLYHLSCGAAPSIADLQIAIVGVRTFGIARGLPLPERYISHQVTFRLAGRWRVWFYQALEPLAPARLMGYGRRPAQPRHQRYRELENFYVRAVAPPLVAVVVALL